MAASVSQSAHFLLDPEVVYLNHGAFGACPEPVVAVYQEWQRELERNPTAFLGDRIDGLLADARAALAGYVHARADDLVFVENATTGVNLAAWALDLHEGDEVVSTGLEYGACDLAFRHIVSHFGARYVPARVPLPVHDADEIVDAVFASVTQRTRALFVSHVTSETALRLPVERLVTRAREAGLATIVDGAHAPGHVPVDLDALGADFYSGNCHKWLCAPKGAGFLHVRRELQERIHPAIVSWGYRGEPTFLTRFELQGTRDPAAYLSVPAAIEFLAANDWDAVRARCHALASRARSELAGLTGEEPLQPDSPEFFGQMVSVRLPRGCDVDELKRRLADEERIVVAAWPRDGDPIMRASFQAYNDESDLETLLRALRRLLR
jgi:isopenicillin-N epimerase